MISVMTTATGWLLLVMGIVIFFLCLLADNKKNNTKMSDQNIHEKLALQREALADQLRAFSRFTMQSVVGNFPIKLTIEVDGITSSVDLAEVKTYPVNEILYTLATNLTGYSLICSEWADQYRKAAAGGDQETPAQIAPDVV